MRSYFVSFIILFVIFCMTAMVQHVYAGILKFNPTSTTTQSSQTFQVQVNVDPRSDQIAGTDVYILYDPAYLEVQSITPGTYFPIVSNNPTTGKVYISAVVENSSQYKTGEGTVATVTFKALQGGSTSLRFDCDLARNDASKIVKNDINATNVIECNGLSTHTITISGGTSGSTGTTTGTTQGSSSLPSGSYSSGYNAQQLPQSGIADSMIKFSIPGLALLVVGITLRLFLKA